jgi:hypothetical protein
LANGAPLPAELVREVTPGFCGLTPENFCILPDGPALIACALGDLLLDFFVVAIVTFPFDGTVGTIV